MKAKLFTYLCIGFSIFSTLGQQIDTDSLLREGINSLKKQEYSNAIAQGRLGIKLAPDYYDFYMLLGRTFSKTGKLESAKYYFKKVVEQAPIYKEAFTHLIRLNIQNEEYDQALVMIERAIAQYPDAKEFRLSKLKVLQLQDGQAPLEEYLIELRERYPEDPSLQRLYRENRAKHSSDRIGIDHSFSFFNREGVGPWHLTGLQYIRERKAFSLIGRINYTDRRAQGESIRSGYQYVLESYIKTGKKGNSYLSASYSSDPVFPELLLFYSYFHNFDSGWETDIGGRYIKTSIDTEIYVATLGIGKYVGSSWLNLQPFLFFDNGQIYPALTANWRLYLNTRFNYLGLLAGYGSSPDESPNIIQFDERAALDSYRVGAVLSKSVGQRFILGLQFIYNRQEYVPDRKQNQFDVFLSLQYKL